MAELQWWEVPGHLEVGKDGDLYLEGHRVQDIVKELEPVHKGERTIYFYGLDWSRHNCREFKEATSGSRPYYAGKALEIPDHLNVVYSEGFGGEVVSPVEIELFMKIGFKPEDIMFTSEASDSAMLYAAKKGVTINMNSKQQLNDYIGMLRRYPFLNGRPIMLRRGSTNKGVGFVEDCITMGADSKFGIPEEELLDQADRIRDVSLLFAGFQQHGGTQIKQDNRHVFIRECAELDKLTLAAIQRGHRPTKESYGSGFSISYENIDVPIDVRSFHQEIMANRASMLGPKNGIEVIYEPGRKIANNGIFVAKVERTGKSYINFIRLNAGFPDYPRPAMYKVYQHIIPITDVMREMDGSFQVAGRVCESGDVFTMGKHEQRDMPRLEKGEYVAILNIPYASMMRMEFYCLFPRPLDIVVERNGFREAEKISQYVNLEHPEYFDVVR